MPESIPAGYCIFLPDPHSAVKAPQLIVLKSCSNPQKTQQVFKSGIKKNFVLGFVFFCE